MARERRLTFGDRRRATSGSSTSCRRAPVAPSSATPSGGPRSSCGCRSAARTTPAMARRRSAAAAAAGVSPVDAAAGLETVTLPPHRSAPVAAGGRTILDDCYNANPASMNAALGALAAASGEGRRFAILGDMLELGPERRGGAPGARAGGRRAGRAGRRRAVRADRRRGSARGRARAANAPSSRLRPRWPPRCWRPGPRRATGSWSRRRAGSASSAQSRRCGWRLDPRPKGESDLPCCSISSICWRKRPGAGGQRLSLRLDAHRAWRR